MKNRHYDMIVEWAATGKKVQCEISVGEWYTHDPTWSEKVNYRFKPEIVRSRRYLYRTRLGCDIRRTNILNENSSGTVEQVESSEGFIRWVDTTWQEHEI